MANKKNEDTPDAAEAPKKTSKRAPRKPAAKKPAAKKPAASRGGRKSARAAKPELLEPAEEVTLDTAAEPAQAGAEARDEDPAPAPKKASSRSRGARRGAKKTEDAPVQEAAPEQKEDSAEQEPKKTRAPRKPRAPKQEQSKAESAPGADNADKADRAPKKERAPAQTPPPGGVGISDFAREFFYDRGLLTRPKGEEKLEDLGEKITYAIPSKPKRATPASIMKQGREWLSSLGGALHVEFAIKSSYDKATKTLNFDLSGEGAKSLLGANLNSPRVLEGMEKILVQFLNLAESDYIVHIDVEKFRQKRSVRLEELAGKLAELSRKVGKPVTIAGMNEFERRVVHRTLTDSESIKTDSFGYGTFRKIRLEPS